MRQTPSSILVGVAAGTALALAGCGGGLERHPGVSGPIKADDRIEGPMLGTLGRACGAFGSGGVRVVAVSLDEKVLAAGYGNGEVVLHAVVDGAVTGRFQAHESPITALTFLADGGLVTGAAAGEVTSWSLPADGRSPRPLVGGISPVRKLLANGAGTVVVSMEADVVRAWRSDGQPLWVDSFDPVNPLRDVFAAGPDRLAVVSSRDHQLGGFESLPRTRVGESFAGKRVLALSPDGTVAVTTMPLGLPAKELRELGVFRYPEGERVWTRQATAEPDGARFSLDGARLAIWWPPSFSYISKEVDEPATHGERLGAYHVTSGARVYGEHLSPLALDIVPLGGGNRLLMAPFPWDERGIELRVLEPAAGSGWVTTPEPGHYQSLTELAVSPDGALALSIGSGIAARPTSLFDRRLRGWDPASGRQVFLRTESTAAFTLGPDGRTLLVTKHHAPLPGETAPPPPPGTDVRGDFELVRMPEGSTVGRIGRLGCYLAVFTPDGEHLWAACVTSGANLRRFRTRDGVEDGQLDSRNVRALTMAISPDGRRLATRDATGGRPTVTVWDLEERRRLWQTELHPPNEPGHIYVLSQKPGYLAFSPDSTLLARWAPRATGPVTFLEGVVRVHAADSGEVVANLVPSGADATRRDVVHHGLAFSPDGALLAARGSRVTLWRTADWSRFALPESVPAADPRRWGGPLVFAGSQLFVGGDDFRLYRVCDVQLPR